MKRKLLIGAVVVIGLLIIGIIILFSMNWGEYESTLEKSTLSVSNDSTTATTLTPSFEKLNGTYIVNAEESENAELLFSVDGLKNTKGAFKNFSAALTVSESVASAQLTVNIVANSINTANKMRDEHLLEEGFFHTAKYPTITYSSTSFTWAAGVYTVNGELSLLAETKPLSFDFKHLGGGTNHSNQAFEAFEGEFTFDRTAYGMEEDASVGNDVTMSFYLELIKE